MSFITLKGQPVPVFSHPSRFYSSVKKNLQVFQFMPVASCPYTMDVYEINICKNNHVSCAQEFEMLSTLNRSKDTGFIFLCK